jgi:hypothetical protein
MRPEAKKDYADEGQRQFNQPTDTLKYSDESCGTLN